MWTPAAPGAGSPPDVAFSVRDASRVPYTAVPTVGFSLQLDSGTHAIRSILLDTQIQIAARRRPYDEHAHDRLFELFGPTADWGRTLRTLLWTRTTVVVPPFTGTTTVQLSVTCTYDLEVTASRYLDALGDGDVPLEFLFSGTVFYAADDGRLQTARISWERESEYRMPVSVWRETMDHHFRDSAWLRVGKDAYDRLSAYKSRHALATWEEAFDALLAGEQAEEVV